MSLQNGVTTATKYYFFNGQRFAQKVGSGSVTYLHADHLGSTVLTTGVAGSKKYHAYGSARSGSVPTDIQFTGQMTSTTGLVYMHARYYDPMLGLFISPDTHVPDPASVYAYNRYMYARGNPLKYADPSGHEACAAQDSACWQRQWQANNNWYNARGFFWGSGHWSVRGNPVFANEGTIDEVAADAGVSWTADAGYAWTLERKRGVANGLVRFGNSLIGGFAGSGLLALATLLGGGAAMQLQADSPAQCNAGAPCAWGGDWHTVYWPDGWFAGKSLDQIGSTAVHELAHVIDWQSSSGGSGSLSAAFVQGGGVPVTRYAQCLIPACSPQWEQWAEGVAAFVYGQQYTQPFGLSPLGQAVDPPNPIDAALHTDQAAIIGGLLGAR